MPHSHTQRLVGLRDVLVGIRDLVVLSQVGVLLKGQISGPAVSYLVASSSNDQLVRPRGETLRCVYDPGGFLISTTFLLIASFRSRHLLQVQLHSFIHIH